MLIEAALKPFCFCLLLTKLALASVPPPWNPCGDEEPTNFTGSFLILAPRVIRPGLPYAVSVNLLKDFTGPVIASVSIRDSKNQTVAQAWAKNLSVGKPTTARIDSIPKDLLPEESYHLYARAELAAPSQVIFEDQEDIRFDSKSLSILIQTDKGIYKPGAEVHFRVIVVGPSLKPHKGQVDVQIVDPQNNVIRQYLSEELKKGIVEKDLILSEEPPLGDWTIKVKTQDDQRYERSFTVDKYVLPKFEAKLKLPPFITIKDDLPVTVSAKYTFGEGVQGKGKVRVAYPWSYGDVEKDHPPIEKTFDLDKSGETVVRFTNAELKEHKLISENGYDTVKVTGSVTEGLTGIERNATEEQIQSYKHSLKVNMEKPGNSFKPGLDYSILLSVVTQDDKPLDSQEKEAGKKVFTTITYSFPYEAEAEKRKEPEIVESEVTIDADGTKVIALDPPVNTTSVSIQANYGSKESEISGHLYVDSAKSPSNNFLALIAEKGELTAGEDAAFTIRSTESIARVTMQVMTRGYVVLSRDIDLNGVDGKFSFETTAEMAPKSRVIIYAVRPDNKEIVVDAIDLNVKGMFQNKVEISIHPNETKPYSDSGVKNEVEIHVTADPDSYIGLAAIDQSVTLLKSGNDITQDLVEDEIRQYDSTSFGGPYFPPWGGRRQKRSFWWPWGISGSDADSLLRNSGMVALTDAYLFRECQPPSAFGAAGAGGGFGGGGGSRGGGSGGGAPVKVRTQFPESWIWESSNSK